MMRAMIVLSVLASSMASPLPQSEVVVPWTGPVAATIPAGLPGAGPNVADTADVAAATSAFNAAFRAQLALEPNHPRAAEVVGALSCHHPGRPARLRPRGGHRRGGPSQGSAREGLRRRPAGARSA